MESLLFLLKGILIGRLFGVPIGAVGAMTVSRTLNHGFGAGMVTGLGSSAADCIYAGVGAFGLTLSGVAVRFRERAVKHRILLNRIFGSLLILFGIVVFISSIR